MDRITELQLQTHNLAKLMADSIGFIQQNAPASAEFVPQGGAAGTTQAPPSVSKEQLTEFCSSYGSDITKTTEAIVEVGGGVRRHWLQKTAAAQLLESVPELEKEETQLARIEELDLKGKEEMVVLRGRCDEAEVLLERVRAIIRQLGEDSLADRFGQ
eukprot:CAMPEP_0114635998 /NCGR_PEP_ID=MMETSP0168-20121206/16766_1 /TAXON_ID=95228 ORGANISM="Vannella sp., Strain DIVA3 517/6/12" /NCGR_SAMPLE_ID=MMETSP0168 /ASSEMBLY_ACC=CAM_ASM_000044 /LENGTH=157 /DNA_ID=CAMNT_0001847711 /DNA_START=21 /DNA_END=495 /DNA_ORIENTATION=-